MKGTMIIMGPEGGQTVRAISAKIDLEELQQAVDGYIELVPYFDEIEHDGKRYACSVFCNEEGKLKGMPINVRATRLWERTLRKKELSLYSPSGELEDA